MANSKSNTVTVTVPFTVVLTYVVDYVKDDVPGDPLGYKLTVGSVNLVDADYGGNDLSHVQPTELFDSYPSFEKSVLSRVERAVAQKS
jgi:hypothetical protein